MNVVADGPLKENFLSLGGLGLAMKWLLRTRAGVTAATENNTQVSGQRHQEVEEEDVDWALATLLCQLLWNALTGLSELWRSAVASELQELEEVLEELVCLDREEEERNGLLREPSEFAAVSFQLMEKASSIVQGL